MRWVPGAWLVLGSLACGGGREAGSVEAVHPTDAVGVSRQAELRVLNVRFVRDASADKPDAGPLFAEVELVVDNIDPGVARGAGVQRSGVALGREAVTLVGDGVRHAAEVVDGKPGWFGPAIDVPPEGASMRRGRVRFALPEGAPANFFLEVAVPGATMRIPLAGPASDSAGAPVRPVYVVGLDGRVPAKGVSVQVGGAEVKRVDGEAAWLVAQGTRSVSAVAEGYEQGTAEAPAGDGPIFVRLTPKAEAQPWARALTWPEAPAQRFDIDALAEQLTTVDQIVDYVRGLGVLPTTGLQRSPSATIARGAGGPIDRAEVARALLARIGQSTQMVCGDLTDADARTVFAHTGAATPVIPAAGAAHTRAAALAAETAPGLEQAGKAPTSARDRYQIRPEWCDVMILVDGKYEPLDLRPTAIAGSPRPFPWRSTPRVDDQLWRVSLVFKAVVRDGPDRWRDVELIKYDTDAATLSEKGFMFDLYQDEVEGRPGLRPMLAVIDRRGVGGQVGTGVTFEGLDRVVLDVTWRDALAIEDAQRSVSLWERQGSDALVTSMRALIAGDATHATLDRATARARDAFTGRWSLPGAEVMMADHELLGTLLGVIRGGITPTAPPVRVTVLHEEAGGTRWRRTEELLATGPASYGEPPTWADRVMMGASLVAANDLFDELGGHPAQAALPPITWASTIDAMLQLPFRDSNVQMRARREAETGGWIGVQGQDRVWRFDPRTGGTSLFGQPVAVPHYQGEPAELAGANATQAKWEVVALCEAIPRWRAVLGTTGIDPAACAPRTAPVP